MDVTSGAVIIVNWYSKTAGTQVTTKHRTADESGSPLLHLRVGVHYYYPETEYDEPGDHAPVC
jgi:hypothetical protein